MKDLYEIIVEEMKNDGANTGSISEWLIQYYKNGEEDDKFIIDKVFGYLVGWDLWSLILKARESGHDE